MTEDSRLRVGHLAGPPLGSGKPVAVLLHGFTQNIHCWGPFATHLGSRFSVIGIDLPGHGDSPADDVSFEGATELVWQALQSIDAPIDLLVGYSMGGRMALRLLIDHPHIAQRMVLVGATAGIDDPTLRQIRIDADQKLAERVEQLGPEAFLDFWLGLSLFSALSEDQHFRAERLQHWGSGVSQTLLHRGTGNMESLWHRLGEIHVPTLVIAGEHDRKFVDIGHKLVEGIGRHAQMRVVEGSSHACHLQHPYETADAIMAWFQI